MPRRTQQQPLLSPAYANGSEDQKRCSMTQRSKWKRARVVPRTIDITEGDMVGPDAGYRCRPYTLECGGLPRLVKTRKEVISSKLDMHLTTEL